MKTLTIIFTVSMFLMVGCHSGEILDNQPLNIQISEVEESEPLYSYPITPWHIQTYSKVRGVPVGAIFYIAEGIYIRYCYLDQGNLVSFGVDVELYQNTAEIQYVADDLSDDAVEYMTVMLERVGQGLSPVDESETELEDEINKI
jgi:hypothetical protein